MLVFILTILTFDSIVLDREVDSLNVKKSPRGEKTRTRILKESAALFACKGYDSVSVREIADAAGIKESSIYNHFSAKSDILETLFETFIKEAPKSRLTEAELDSMLPIMRPEEIFKNILFHFGNRTSATVENVAMIINNEKFKNPRAAQIYYVHVVEEPVNYFERLINKMAARKMIKSVDARIFAEQYNYVSIALTKEYFMAKNGLADMDMVIKSMVRTLNFFCEMMNK